MTAPASSAETLRTERALDAVNAFLADVRDGLGPYLAVYLLTVEKWDEASIGYLMTIVALAGIVAQTPIGALVDATRAKRLLLVVAAVAVTATAVSLPLLHDKVWIAITQSLSAIAGSIFAPAIAAVTLGIVGPRAFTRRMGRNEAFNHAGNAVSAALAAGLSYLFGPAVVFWLMAAMAILSIAATLAIPASAIDDDLARGLVGNEHERQKPASLSSILRQRPALLIFAVSVVLFHFANAAMLPLVGQKLALLSDPSLGTSLMAICIVVAQLIMVPVAWLTGTKADTWGRKPLFLAAFGVLALRGALYPLSDNMGWLVAVQALDGVGAGIFGALFPVVVADVTRGTGHFNVCLGAVATATGLGAATSTAFAGAIVTHAGYSAAFLALAAVAGAGLALYALQMPETRDWNASPYRVTR